MRAYVVAAFVFALLSATAPSFAAPAVEQAGVASSPGDILECLGNGLDQGAINCILSTSSSASPTETATGTTTSTTAESTSSSTASLAIIKRQGTTATTTTASSGLPSPSPLVSMSNGTIGNNSVAAQPSAVLHPQVLSDNSNMTVLSNNTNNTFMSHNSNNTLVSHKF